MKLDSTQGKPPDLTVKRGSTSLSLPDLKPTPVTPTLTTPRTPTDTLTAQTTKSPTSLKLTLPGGTGNPAGTARLTPQSPADEPIAQATAGLTQGLATARTDQALQSLQAKAADARLLLTGATGPAAEQLQQVIAQTERASQAYALSSELAAAKDPKARASAIAGILNFPGGPAGVSEALGARESSVPGVKAQLDPAALQTELTTTLGQTPDLGAYPPGTGDRLAALNAPAGTPLAGALDKVASHALASGGFLGMMKSTKLTYDQVQQRPDFLAAAARLQADPTQAAAFSDKVVAMAHASAEAHSDAPDATLASRLAGVQQDLKAWEAAGVSPENLAKARQAAMSDLGLGSPAELQQALDDSLAARAGQAGVNSEQVFQGMAQDVAAHHSAFQRAGPDAVRRAERL